MKLLKRFLHWLADPSDKTAFDANVCAKQVYVHHVEEGICIPYTMCFGGDGQIRMSHGCHGGDGGNGFYSSGSGGDGG
jgi:hypothetical protein